MALTRCSPTAGGSHLAAHGFPCPKPILEPATLRHGTAVGDPCWDIGSALSHYLSFWLFSIPVTGPCLPSGFRSWPTTRLTR